MSISLEKVEYGGWKNCLKLSGDGVELVVTLAESKITTGDLIGLRVGDIITTEKDVHQPLDVAVEGAS